MSALMVLTASAMLGLAAPLGPVQANAPQSQPEHNAASARLQRRLDELDARLQSISTVRAEFEQRKFTPMLKQPLLSTGVVTLKGNAARWDTRKPRPSTMTIAAGEITVYYPEARAVEIYEARGDIRELWGSLLPRIAVLREHFLIEELSPSLLGVNVSVDQELLALELSPRSDELKEHVKDVRVLIDAATPCVRKMIITDADGDRTELEFKSVQLNANVEDSEMELTWPKGTKVSRPDAAGDRNPAATAPDRKPDK